MNTTVKPQNVNGAETNATSEDVNSTTSTEEVRTEKSSTTQEISLDSASSVTDEQQTIRALSENCNNIFSRIKEIQRAIARPEMLTPKKMADLRSESSGYYGYLMGEAGELKILRAEMWPQLKLENKTDKSAQMAWEATEAGKLETRILARKSSLENISSVLRTALEVVSNEMRNI